MSSLPWARDWTNDFACPHPSKKIIELNANSKSRHTYIKKRSAEIFENISKASGRENFYENFQERNAENHDPRRFASI
jgi:hypothetical protein